MDKEYSRWAMYMAQIYGNQWLCSIGMPMLFDGGLFVNREPLNEWEYKMNLDGRIRQMEIMNDEY